MLPPLKSPPFVLFVVNKIDEEFRQSGASINMMDNVFKKFISKQDCMILTATSFTNMTLYKHDPVNFNSDRIMTFNGLIKNSHIYTLNHNLKSLKRKEEPENNYCVRCHQHYYINDRKEALKYTMINDITDIPHLKDKD